MNTVIKNYISMIPNVSNTIVRNNLNKKLLIILIRLVNEFGDAWNILTFYM